MGDALRCGAFELRIQTFPLPAVSWCVQWWARTADIEEITQSILEQEKTNLPSSAFS